MKDKLFKANKNSFIVEINEIEHKIQIKTNIFTSKFIVLVDDKIHAQDEIHWCTRRMFYSMYIDNVVVIIEFKDEGFSIDKNIYINSYSIITGEHIDKEKLILQEIVEMGLCKYLIKNYTGILKVSIMILIFFLIDFFKDLYKGNIKLNNNLWVGLSFFIISSFIISVFYFIFNWFSYKRKYQKWDNQYINK